VRRFVAFLAVALCLVASQAFADHWKAGDDVYAFDVGFTNTSGEKDLDLTGTWLHYAADNHRVGMTILYLNNESADGYGVGPSYEFLTPKLKHGRIGFGGDASALGQDLSQAGAIGVATRAFYELYVGDSAAIRIQARWLKVASEDDPALADQVNNYGLGIGILLGAPAGVPVQ
jgi:hypothetical protein